MDEELIKEIERTKPKEEHVKSSRVIPILILMFLFGGFLGYFIHEQFVGYYCTIELETWNSRFEAKIPLDGFTEKLIEIDNAKNLLPSGNFSEFNIEEERVKALLEIDEITLLEDY